MPEIWQIRFNTYTVKFRLKIVVNCEVPDRAGYHCAVTQRCLNTPEVVLPKIKFVLIGIDFSPKPPPVKFESLGAACDHRLFIRGNKKNLGC